MIKVEEKFFEDYKKVLIDQGESFTVFVNNMSSRIEGGYLPPIYTGTSLALKHIAFIASVKRHVRKKIDEGKLVIGEPLKKAAYFDPGTKRSGIVTDGYEVDIDSAYWETAFQQKVISRDIYRYGLTIPKKVRLMALGALGKKTEVHYFDGKKFKTLDPIFDPETCYVWDKICGHIGDVMTTISSNIDDKDYFFYWTDALFVRKKVVVDVKKMIRKFGYDFKVKKIDKMTFTERQIIFYESDKDEDDQRSFMLPSNKNKYNKDLIV